MYGTSLTVRRTTFIHPPQVFTCAVTVVMCFSAVEMKISPDLQNPQEKAHVFRMSDVAIRHCPSIAHRRQFLSRSPHAAPSPSRLDPKEKTASGIFSSHFIFFFFSCSFIKVSSIKYWSWFSIVKFILTSNVGSHVRYACSNYISVMKFIKNHQAACARNIINDY